MVVKNYYNPSTISDGMHAAIEHAIEEESESLGIIVDAKYKYDIAVLARKTWLLVDTVSFLILASVVGVVTVHILRFIGVMA